MLNQEMELTGLLTSHWVWAAAVIAAVLLGAKQRIQTLLRNLSHLELKASLQLLVIVLVVLPLLPNQAMGPWDSINPRVIGWLVILIASISFAGYFAVKLLGARVGLIMTALLAGLVSSTALTLAFSRMARACHYPGPASQRPIAGRGGRARHPARGADQHRGQGGDGTGGGWLAIGTLGQLHSAGGSGSGRIGFDLGVIKA